MEIINKVRKKTLVEQVNEIIAESFGPTFRGDYCLPNLMSLWDDTTYQPLRHSLCLLGQEVSRQVRSGWFSKKTQYGLTVVGQLGAVKGVAANLSNGEYNGSVIAVHPNFEAQARKYAETYERKFANAVKVILTDHMEQTDPSVLEFNQE